MASAGLGWSTKGLQSVCPTGVATFDRLIGGGFALSSINVIDEDCDRMYSSMLAKAYLSLGIIANQNVIIFSSTIKSKNSRFLKELPSLQASSDNGADRRAPGMDDSMKIAFRYSNLPSRFAANQEGEDSSAQKLDFGQSLDPAVLESASISFYDHTEILSVLEGLHHYQQQQSKSSTVTRILIDEIGSPLSTLPLEQLPKMFHRLKVLLRRSPQWACLATLVCDRTSIATQESANESLNLLNSLSLCIRERIHSHADSVIRLIGFGDEYDAQEEGSNPYAADYVGFLHLLRLPRLNSFAPYNPTLESTEFGIKLRNSKRYLAIEKLALPPDLGETVNRFTSSAKTSEHQHGPGMGGGLPCANTFTNF